MPKRAGLAAAPLWRRLMRARPGHGHGSSNGNAPPTEDHGLESMVDVHAFVPADLARVAKQAGFENVRVRGEELLANWFGWFNRTVESTAEPSDIPWPWIQYAYRGYVLLQEVDRRLLEPHLPSPLFYNLMLVARAPGSAPPAPPPRSADLRVAVGVGRVAAQPPPAALVPAHQRGRPDARPARRRPSSTRSARSAIATWPNAVGCTWSTITWLRAPKSRRSTTSAPTSRAADSITALASCDLRPRAGPAEVERDRRDQHARAGLAQRRAGRRSGRARRPAGPSRTRARR